MMVREVPGLTIDDVSTRDIDDAIFIERQSDGWKLLISIADVGRDVPLGSELDLDAYARTATRYFASGNSPMLPRNLSENLLSLWPKVARFVVTVEVALNEALETTGVEVYEAGIKSQAKLSYDQIPGILAAEDHPHHALVKNARGIALTLLDKRRQAGALVMYDLNNGWVTTEEGAIRKLANKDDVIGYIIIQEMMILANAAVADFGLKRGIPLLFRNHEAYDGHPPDRKALIDTITQAAQGPIEGLDALREQTHKALKRAAYGAAQLGHFGLNLPAYLHFTSPIRRYADLVNHRQIVALLRGEELPYTVDRLEEIAQHLNEVSEQQRNGRTEAEKDRAENRAQKALDARKLDGLNAKDFERVVKVEARRGEQEDAAEALCEAFTRRLDEGRMPLICVAILFGEAPEGLPRWTELRAKSLAWLEAHPEDAVSVLTLGVQNVGWPEASFTTTDVGQSHEKTFFVLGRVGEHAFQGVAKTAKLAKQRAAVGLVALLGGLVPPLFEPVPVGPTARTAPPPPMPSSDGNPVGRLQEFCQQRSKPAPNYEFVQQGPDHLPVITCTCTFGNVKKVAVAASKKEAKKLAAQAVLAELRI